MKLISEEWHVKAVVDTVKKHAKNEGHLFVGMPNNVMWVNNYGSTPPASTMPTKGRRMWGAGVWESEFLLNRMVEWLATAYPQFTYAVQPTKELYSTAHLNLPASKTLYVFAGLKPIGKVTSYHRGDKISLRFTNQRIEVAMHHKKYQQTANFSKAKKIFKTYFYPPTPIELGITAEDRVKDVMNTMGRELSATLHRATSIIQKTVVDNINSPAVAECLTAMGHGGLVSSFLDARENLDLATGMTKMVMHRQGGAIVQLQEDKYLIRTNRDSDSGTHNIETEMLDRSELPPKAREGIALLKMTEPNTYIAGVGFKATDTEFFLVDSSNDAEVTDEGT